MIQHDIILLFLVRKNQAAGDIKKMRFFLLFMSFIYDNTMVRFTLTRKIEYYLGIGNMCYMYDIQIIQLVTEKLHTIYRKKGQL